MSTTLTIYTKASTSAAWGALALVQYLTDEFALGAGLTTEFEAEHANGIPCELKSEGATCNTPQAAIKSLAAAFAAQGLCGKDHTGTQQVDGFCQLASEKIQGVTDFTALSSVADTLDQRLTLRSFTVGHHVTAADFAVWGAIKGNVPFLGIMKRNLHPHLARWFSYIDTLPSVKTAISAYQAAQKNKIKARTANASFELGLQNAVQGKVVTRFPPEPSGYLHIGHAKAAILNQFFARQYEGKFLIRFDDTNPSKEKAEFQDSILEDLSLMGIKGDAMSYTSDYFDQLFQHAITMIKSGKAYTDNTAQQQMRDERMNGIASAHRDDSVESNLEHFAQMQAGTEEGVKWCLRAKISSDDPNKAMRDPVIYRCNLEPHHRTGNTWKIYPGYDFACPIVDCLEGVTHALRTNEYRDRNPQYWWMLDALNMRKVDIWDFGRINFTYTLLSKRKLKAMVEEKQLVGGWDDPRFPTVRGIRRRGLTIEALKSYMLAQGPSQAQTSLEWDGIWSTNKKVIDPVAPRHAAVLKANSVKVIISGSPEEHSQAVPKHKKNLELGNKTTVYAPEIIIEQEDAASFEDNEEITLMDWGNAIIRKKEVDSHGHITSIQADLHLEGDFKKTSKKVHWLASSSSAPLIPCTLIDYDYLITKKKIEEEDNWEDFINPKTEYRTDVVADNNVAQLKKGEIIQFERKGYYIVDRAYGEGGQESLDCIFIPDGKASSVVLKAPPPPAKNPSKVPAALSGSSSSTLGSLPSSAPSEPVTTVLKSSGSNGFDIPVTTKMYAVDPPVGKPSDADLKPAESTMYRVTSLYE